MSLRSTLLWQLAQSLEQRWWRRYLSKQPIEAYLARKTAYWQRVLVETGVRPRPGERVLDAGCGPAGIFIALAPHAVDALDPLLEVYRRDFPHLHAGRYPSVQFYPGPLENGAPNPPYDLVYCLNAINHVRDLDAALSALTAALTPGGRLLLSTDAHRFRSLQRLFRLLPGDALHPQQYTTADYLAKLGERGLEIVQCRVLKRGRVFDYVAFEEKKSEIGY